MIKRSARLDRVKRLFDPYLDRSGYVRLDRNEDPVGWEPSMFREFVDALTPDDFAAYSDSTVMARKLCNWLGVATDQVMITAGSDAAIKNLFETYVDEGDIVLCQDPNWRMYEVYGDIYRAKPVFVAYDRELSFDTGAVLKHIRGERVRVVLLANPNQPTGTLIPAHDLEEIISCALQRDTVVAIDEAYHLFTDETTVPLVAKYPNLIVTRTFSKAFSLAGPRIGYCVADKARIDDLMLLRPVTDANSIALKCAEFALDHVDRVLERAADVIRGREYLYNECIANGVSTYKSHANFLLLKCNSPDAANAVMQQARQRKYLLKGPFNFPPLENHVRISIGPLDLMRRFWADCGETLVHHAAAKPSRQTVGSGAAKK